jgi:hypothetical protein
MRPKLGRSALCRSGPKAAIHRDSNTAKYQVV